VSRVERVDSMEEMEAKHIVRIDGSVASDHERLRVFVRPVRYQRFFYIMVCDSTGAIEPTEFIIGQVRVSTSKPFGFGDSLLEMQMLQAMKGIGMDEGADRPLFVKNLCCMGHLRAKTFPFHICRGVSLGR
jgi:hypothetical protein